MAYIKGKVHLQLFPIDNGDQQLKVNYPFKFLYIFV